MKKYYYMYIGDTFHSIDKKQIRFVVESETRLDPTKREKYLTFSGRVVFRNADANWSLGSFGRDWRSPYSIGELNCYPAFVEVDYAYAKANFEFEFVEKVPFSKEAFVAVTHYAGLRTYFSGIVTEDINQFIGSIDEVERFDRISSWQQTTRKAAKEEVNSRL